MKNTLTVVIISGNAVETIESCLNSALFADRIILVAANSTDGTVPIVKSKYPDVTIITTHDSYNQHFSKWRNLGYQAVTTSWLFYLDTDEIIPPALKDEITYLINQPKSEFSYYVVPRENYYLNHRVRFGGSYPDYVKRLFNMKYFKGFTGILHEEPKVTGKLGYLKFPLKHYTHPSLNQMLKKSISWTEIEAQEIYKYGHPPVVWWRFIRMMLTKFWQRLVTQSMWRDGIVGWISVIFETFDTFMIYAKLYELQRQHA